MQIKGKTALITGAAAGIGRAIAVSLAQKGARHLTLCDIDEAGLRETATLAEALGASVTRRRLDVSDHQDVERALEEADRGHGLDIVINNAGVVVGVPEYPDTPLERMARLVSINLTGVIVGTAVAARLMTARGGGVVINTASRTVLNPRLEDAPYRASKAGVIMLTQCCKSLSEKGVRVNAISPGIVDTPILRKAGSGSGTPDWIENAARHIRIWAPEDMAAAMVSLIEDDSKAGEVLDLANEAREPAAP